MAPTEDYEVIVIGAGLYGIQAARYYLDIHPEANLCILESDDVVGGTWSSKRIYDAFWTQTPVGMAEFSDRPMTPPPLEDQYYGFFPARYVTAYLESYVDNHVYNGRSLRDRVVFNVLVDKVVRTPDNRWRITCQSDGRFETSKLIDATGMTSLPNVPHLTGQEDFRGKVIHHKNFGQLGDLGTVRGQHFAILGGGKSAADIAYSAAKAGKTVSWIIREDGAGPAALLSAEGKGPYANSNESFYTRFVAAFLPNHFGEESYLSMFLHKTRVGQWLVRTMWDGIDKDQRKKVDYKRAEGRHMGFNKLEPDTPIFWQNDSSGVNQRPDFYSTIATRVHVYRQNVDHLLADSVTLAASQEAEEKQQTLPVDMLVLCTGWSSVSPIYAPKLAEELGLPVQLEWPLSLTNSQEDEYLTHVPAQTLNHKEGQMILDRFPLLQKPPDCRETRPSHTPFRLYRALVPTTDQGSHSIIFLGKMVVGNNFLASEVQALWAVAYLDGNLKLESRSTEREVDETIAWCRKRYLNKGELGSWFYFDVVDYADMLLAQLGLKSHRQKGWLRNLFAPVRAADLKDLAYEYKSLYSS